MVFGDLDKMKLRLGTLHISRWTAVGAVVLLTTSSAWPQMSRAPDTSLQRPATGATPGVIAPPNPSALSGTYTPRHRSPNGTVCLKMTGMARPFNNNSNLFNHWIYAENGCSDCIRLHVCYYSTTSCIDISVPGHDRKEAILGTLPSIKDFRYEYGSGFSALSIDARFEEISRCPRFYLLRS